MSRSKRKGIKDREEQVGKSSKKNALHGPFTSAAGEAVAEAPRWRKAGRYLRPGLVWTPYEPGVSGRWTCRRSGWRCCGEGWLSTARRPAAGGWGWKHRWMVEAWMKAEGNLRQIVSGRGLWVAAAHWTSWPGRTRAGLRIPASRGTGSIERQEDIIWKNDEQKYFFVKILKLLFLKDT